MTDPHHTTEHTTLYHGNNMDVLPTLPDNSVDAVITDPPYELGFMGKAWDASGIAYSVDLWAEILRVLKPGGHLCAFGGTRTYHRMTVAIEDAGFEIRDSIHWLYGSGFPKSLDVSKAIDKAAGAEREVIGTSTNSIAGGTGKHAGENDAYRFAGEFNITAPATDAAKQWDGWGTALKPAHEPIVLARKPFTGTVAANVLQHGTGALNIDATRIGDDTMQINTYTGRHAFGESQTGNTYDSKTTTGRWPANVIVDDTITDDWARYFYCAKPSRAERNAGLDGLPKGQPVGGADKWTEQDRRRGDGVTRTPTANTHPTVKPITLMRYLIRLVTPPGGTILDPFAGSGTTLAAAIIEGFYPIGIELTDDYLPIIEARCNWAETQTTQRTLFDND